MNVVLFHVSSVVVSGVCGLVFGIGTRMLVVASDPGAGLGIGLLVFGVVG